MDELVDGNDASELDKTNTPDERTSVQLGETSPPEDIGNRYSNQRASDNGCVVHDKDLQNTALIDYSYKDCEERNDTGDLSIPADSDRGRFVNDKNNGQICLDKENAGNWKNQIIKETLDDHGFAFHNEDTPSMPSDKGASVVQTLDSIHADKELNVQQPNSDWEQRLVSNANCSFTKLTSPSESITPVSQKHTSILSSCNEAANLGSSFGGLVIRHSSTATRRGHGERQLANTFTQHMCVPQPIVVKSATSGHLNLQGRPILHRRGDVNGDIYTYSLDCSQSRLAANEPANECNVLKTDSTHYLEDVPDFERDTVSGAKERSYTCICDKDDGVPKLATELDQIINKNDLCSLVCLCKNTLSLCAGCSVTDIIVINEEIIFHSRFVVNKIFMGDEQTLKDGVDLSGSNIERQMSCHSNGDSAISTSSDDVFVKRLPSTASSSCDDVNSMDSLSAGNQVVPRDTASSRMRYELRHGNHQHGPDTGEYLTPLQRKEREVKELRREIAQLLKEKEERDSEILSLKCALREERSKVEEVKDREIAELREKLRVSEMERFDDKEEICKAQDELTRMDERYTALKRQMSEKEEKFEEYLLDMYKKGQQAAAFEREEELEMLASSKKSRVSVKELTRKLSRTESELAKWQGLKLDESYTKSEPPETQADVTLSFVKDAFFHFLSDTCDNEDHLRAMLKIFKYSESQKAKIWKGLEEFKNLDKKKLIKKKEGT